MITTHDIDRLHKLEAEITTRQNQLNDSIKKFDVKHGPKSIVVDMEKAVKAGAVINSLSELNLR